MSRCIVIESCKECPRCDHQGGFGQIAYVPVCRATGKTLPYAVAASDAGRAYASPTYVIPTWCPLEQYEKDAK